MGLISADCIDYIQLLIPTCSSNNYNNKYEIFVQKHLTFLLHCLVVVLIPIIE